MSVLDLSRYDIPTFDAQCFKDNGVTGIILASFREDEMRQCALLARDAGLPIIGFYGFIYFGSGFGETRDTEAAIRLAQEFNVSRVWLDCETDALANGFTDAIRPTPEQRVDAIRRCFEMVESQLLDAGIYTGGWWWPSNTNNSTAFAGLPLWHSDYGANDGTKPPVTTVNYGGWTKVAVHQYTSRLNVCGRERDGNYVLEEEDMADPRVDKILAFLGDVDGWIANGNVPLIEAYAMEQQKLATHRHPAVGPTIFPEVARDG